MRAARLVPILAVILGLSLGACRPPGYGDDDGGDGSDGDDMADDAMAMPDAAGESDGDVTVDGAGTDAAGVACEQTFRLDGYGGAGSVWLTGDFVDWATSPGGGAVELALAGNVWTVTHGFAAGSYQYKFIVDNTNWIPDPGNPDGIEDGFGGRNSLYTCAP